MRIPRTPTSIESLDLMIMLKENFPDDEACQILYSNTVSFVNKMLIPLLSQINAREMETFTMHDSNHSLKVAHLMFHIIHPDRRNALTPPEISLLVISAFLHDLGMALSPKQREEYLDPKSDLWYLLEVEENLKSSINQLKKQVSDNQISDPIRDRARRKLHEAEEALLCKYTRQKHATRQRYDELLTQLQQFHNDDPSSLPDVESCLSFGGDSFREKLIEICVSHGQDLEFLLGNDETNIERHRFPKDYPIGSYTADLHMVAAALRLADILDFDRERTPPVLFYYLLPTNLAPQDDRSILEWSKHLTISHWQIDEDSIVYRGHCNSHIIHHAIVHFCNDIENEIKSTRDTFSTRKTDFPFNLPKSVQTKIEQQGYTYVPYKFELDDNRVYQLLMGGAIYDNPLVAVRELIQNAVDACKLKDALIQMYEPQIIPNVTDRITICYEETTGKNQEPKLIVTDTGTGMDKWILEKYFLKVGISYYNSPDFNKIRFQLRSKNEELDFAPISEFGIGFLSCFLLSDRLQVDTAMWESIRGDTLKRTLIIDGPTRLIRLSEYKNEGLDRFKGTSITLHLSRGNKYYKDKPPDWHQIKDYLLDICQDLPYRLNLEFHSSDVHVTHDSIDRIPLTVQLPEKQEPISVRIPVDDDESGLEGEIVIINPYLAEKIEHELSVSSAVTLKEESTKPLSPLIRGGFKIGDVIGLPRCHLNPLNLRAKLRFNWKFDPQRRYPLPNLARNQAANEQLISQHVLRLWLNHFLSNVDSLPEGLLYELSLDQYGIWESTWLEQYDALTIYKLARQGWLFVIRDDPEDSLETWESCSGESLLLGRIYGGQLYQNLLNLILPKISTLQVNREGDLYVKPPKPGWRKLLGEWRNYITSPVKWGQFTEYIGDIENLLYYQGSYRFNSRFRKKIFDSFGESDLDSILDMFRKLAEARVFNRQARLANYEIQLLNRACNQLGNIEIGVFRDSWRIDSFKP